MPQLMKCGDRANSEFQGKPCCIIHLLLTKDALIPIPTPDLTGRMAHCAYGCGEQRPSSIELAFFRHTPERTHDTYYCGCMGWD